MIFVLQTSEGTNIISLLRRSNITLRHRRKISHRAQARYITVYFKIKADFARVQSNKRSYQSPSFLHAIVRKSPTCMRRTFSTIFVPSERVIFVPSVEFYCFAAIFVLRTSEGTNIISLLRRMVFPRGVGESFYKNFQKAIDICMGFVILYSGDLMIH